MSAFHTNLSAPLLGAQHTTSVLSSNLIVKTPESQSIGKVIGSGTSLAQLMSEHEKMKAAGSSQNVSLGSLLGTSPSMIPSLSLGTLASLNLSSTPTTSAPSLLAVSLNSLTLTNTKPTTATSSSASLPPPPGFGSLSSILQNNNNSTGGKNIIPTESKTGPSLADLIQEHSNHSPQNLNNFGSPHSNLYFGNSMVSPTLSLSELASQHQNKNCYPVSSTSLSSTVSLTQLGSQHEKQSKKVLPLGTNFKSNVFTQPPILSELLTETEHKDKTSTTSNGSQDSFGSQCSPAKPEKAGECAQEAVGEGTRHKSDHKPQTQKIPKLVQSIDLSALMSQSHCPGHRHFDTNLPSPSSSPLGLGLDSSVFAKPSLFALTLSFRSRKKPKRKLLMAKMKHQSAGRLKMQYADVEPIVPFRFDTPSPDDIVRANQSKAFTR